MQITLKMLFFMRFNKCDERVLERKVKIVVHYWLLAICIASIVNYNAKNYFSGG